MYILVKNLNSRLIFVMNDEVQFNILLDELKSLLKQSFFKKEDYYPKAFFDFQCRILKEDEILAFFKVLVECQSLLFGGFVEKKTQKEQEIRMIEGSIHGGEVIEINEDFNYRKNQSRSNYSIKCQTLCYARCLWNYRK